MDTLDFQPIMKTKAIVVQSAADKQHDPVIMIAEIGPLEAGPPAHIHPTQLETYEVVEGEAEFILDGKRRLVRQGEKIDIPAGTSHTFINITDTWLKMRDTHQPGLSFEQMMRELHGLVHSGKIKGFGDVKSLVYLSMLWVKHQEMQRSIQPPFIVMRCMNLVGKLLGYKI